MSEHQVHNLAGMAASYYLKQMYELAVAYLSSHDDKSTLSNPLIWYMCLQRRHINREVWAYIRDQYYFEDVLRSTSLEHFFNKHFRMNRDTFNKLCNVVGPYMQRQRTHLREPIPVPIRVALALRRLGKGETFEALLFVWRWRVHLSRDLQ